MHLSESNAKSIRIDDDLTDSFAKPSDVDDNEGENSANDQGAVQRRAGNAHIQFDIDRRLLQEVCLSIIPEETLQR